MFAAVRSKADAIYIGAKDFSARASAKNFSMQELSDAVRYCHRNSVKVYLALNTIVFDDEFDEALKLVKNAAKCDIDAVIVQDIGLATAIKKVVPQLKLHASTQMSVHTLSGAQALKELGFSRVVLAREMTKDEIKYIADNCDIELEVFVHGALCMCVSGQCYMSAVLGTRSANRGMCAQPCRLPFAVDNSKHALSLKDNSIIEYIKELEEIGVASAKIEGRMKRPEYVACATSACVQMRDNGFVNQDTLKRLQAVFSRTGFTDGYYNNLRGYDMFGYRRKNDVVSASEKLFKEIRTTYKDECGRVLIDFEIEITEGQKVSLSVSDGSNTVCVQSDFVAQSALNLPLDEEKVSSYLNKTGDTPYIVNSVKCNINGKPFLPAKDINAIRRSALEKLSQKREIRHSYSINDLHFVDFVEENVEEKAKVKSTRAISNDLNIPQSFDKMEYVFVPLFDCVKDIELVKQYISNGINIAVEIPRATFSVDEKVIKSLKKVREIGVKNALCHNIGAAYICKRMGIDFHLSFAMNIANSVSLMWAKEYGASDVEVSFELDVDRINALKSSIKKGVFGYGYIPLMITRNCPAKSAKASCATCKKDIKLQDRKGEKFIIKCNKIVTEILNCVPLILPKEINKSKNLDFTVFHFSVENSVENKEKILENLSENRKFERFTHGLYLRGVKNFTIF